MVTKQVLRDRSFRISILLTLIFFTVGIIFLLLGLSNYGWLLFVFLPIIVGISIGALPDRRWATYGAMFAAIIFLLLLLAGHLSGFICILMVLPLIIPLLFLGSVFTHLMKRYWEIKDSSYLPVLLLPLLLFVIAAPIERSMTRVRTEDVAVTTVRVYHYTPLEVYDAIKSVDTLYGEKPLLMHFDLPVPVKCVLEQEAIGGTRTCYFHGGNLSGGDFGGGVITERITQLDKGRSLVMDVTSYNLIGRKWLGFKKAAYYFDPIGDSSCKMTRITTYTSELTPRFYWEPLERLGIEQEHQYVFDNLARQLNEKYGSRS